MSVSKTQANLVHLDNFFDYVPAGSTVTAIVAIFIKCVVIPYKGKANISNHHYFNHIDQKSFTRCFILLVPAVGNIIIAIIDYKNSKKNNDSTLPADPATPPTETGSASAPAPDSNAATPPNSPSQPTDTTELPPASTPQPTDTTELPPELPTTPNVPNPTDEPVPLTHAPLKPINANMLERFAYAIMGL